MRRIYEKLCLDSPRVANLGRCHAYLGCRNMLLRDFHLPLFVTDKWVKCYCELILGLASLYVPSKFLTSIIKLWPKISLGVYSKFGYPHLYTAICHSGQCDA